jgi:starch phosphorylase
MLLRVLLVDDDPEAPALIARELARTGFDPQVERVDSEAAFRAQLAFAPDLVLAEYDLLQFSGVRALQVLQEAGLSVPFIVVSGAIGEEAAVAILKHGAADFVHKEHLERLAPAVLRALQGERKIAYFSMEIALDPDMPTYSGGLGVLAGDTIRSAADLRVPIVAISLLHRAGYFQQRLDDTAWQREEPVRWAVGQFLTEMPVRARVTLEGRRVHLRSWKYQVLGESGYSVPVYLLDSDLPENSEWDRRLTDVLYGGDDYYRLCQEIVLGIGGVRMLRALGYERIERFHMNEGHSSLLTLELLREEAGKNGRRQIELDDLVVVRPRCIFTTHTPVPAGHDQFPLSLLCRVLGFQDDLADAFHGDMAARVFGRRDAKGELEPFSPRDAVLNMTYMGLNMSRHINGVAKKHRQVSQLMFGGYRIDAITNGVHAATWASGPFRALFDRHIPDWRHDTFSLRHAESIARQEVWDAHMQAKQALLRRVQEREGTAMDADTFTIGLARRAAPYKRPDLLFTDIPRLISLTAAHGRVQVVLAGKAHPRDHEGKLLIQRIARLKEPLKDRIKIAFLEDYDMSLGQLMTAGVDLWLNTPQPPLEASGTSGMKAAVNGVPSLSILDGWWLEGLIEGVTGWAIGDMSRARDQAEATAHDAASLYDKLEHVILPLFYTSRAGYIDVMRHAIALNGSFFNTQRMLQQYVSLAYFD